MALKTTSNVNYPCHVDIRNVLCNPRYRYVPEPNGVNGRRGHANNGYNPLIGHGSWVHVVALIAHYE